MVRSRSRVVNLAIGAILGIALWATTWLGLIVGQLRQAHPDNQWVESAYALKARAAEAIGDQKKLIIVGGSASMFGVNSILLGEELDLAVVNFGVNAGIGTYALPPLADPHINAGDLVLMPIEYRLLLWDGMPSYVTLSWVLENPQSLTHWRLKSLVVGLWQLPFQRVVEGYRALPLAVPSSAPYGAHRLSPWGDQTGSAADKRTPAQQASLTEAPPEVYHERYASSTLGLEVWAQWWRRWQERGACIVVVPPPLMERPAYAGAKAHAFFSQVPARVRSAGAPYLGQPQAVFFPPKAMFDTNYHLTSEAREVYTAWLVRRLNEESPCPLSPVSP